MRPHRDVPGESRAATTIRPRRARIVAAAAALGVTLVSVLGGLGVLPTTSSATARTPDSSTASAGGAVLSSAAVRTQPSPPSDAQATPPAGAQPPVPASSGTGRRIVFDMTRQRVWLVDHRGGKDVAVRTYPVSGSVTDNLHPGSYAVYSKSMQAWGVDDSGTMRYMVRFAHGPNAAIGFHDIPVFEGHPVQTRQQLGTPLYHGCIRQWRTDAQALWRFAPVGTKVVVVA